MTKLRYILSVVATIFLPVLICAQGLLGFTGEEGTSVGMYIKDLRSGEVLIDHNSRVALTPASVMKAVTTATVLSVKDCDDRFITPVVLRGIEAGGCWKGDLVVKSCGDPTLESENFKRRIGFCDSIVSALKCKGISSISGQIVVEQYLSDQGPIAQWEIEDVPWPYGAGLYGFNYRDNSFRVYPADGRTIPDIPGLKLTVRRIDKGTNLIRGVNSSNLIVETRTPTDPKVYFYASMPDPAEAFKEELAGVLRRAGIELRGEKVAEPEGEEILLYEACSPRYSEIMRSLMVRSDNLFAEGMLRLLAPDGTRREAIEMEKDTWEVRGIDTSCTFINDGSGLTRANRLSPRFVGDVLEWMASSPYSEAYTSFFPRAGLEGTLRTFLAKSTLKGKVALKTGSVSGVQTYAGYILDRESKPTHSIVIFVDGFFCPRVQVRQAAERLLEELF